MLEQMVLIYDREDLRQGILLSRPTGEEGKRAIGHVETN